MKNYCTSYLKHLAGKPTDPRYNEAILELNNRGTTLDFVIIPDRVIEKALTSDIKKFIEPTHPKLLQGLRNTAAKALGYIKPGSKEEKIRFKGLHWYFRKEDDCWILYDINIKS